MRKDVLGQFLAILVGEFLAVAIAHAQTAAIEPGKALGPVSIGADVASLAPLGKPEFTHENDNGTWLLEWGLVEG